jgi:anti-anti-sigma factor
MTAPCFTNGHIVHVKGPLRAPVNGDVRRRMSALLQCGERHIVLDLERLTRIDAAGLGELVRAYNMARALDATCQVVNPNARVRELIERGGLADVLLADRVATI